MEHYTIKHPGYYNTEPIISHIPNPPREIYNTFGIVIGYENVPDTEVVNYENIWHLGRIKNEYQKTF